MAKAEAACRFNNIETSGLNVDFMRSLVKQYTELGQWTSALFWADSAAAAAAGGSGVANGDDVWLLASTMLARGELHRAAYAVTSRDLHRRHLLCLGVVMRAYLAMREPSTALSLMEECDPALLELKASDQTHNRALAGVLVWQAKALSALERREAAAAALSTALRTDCACYEALDLLLEQHSLSPRQERELIESLPIGAQLGAAEGALVRAAYRERLQRHAAAPACTPAPAPAPDAPPPDDQDRDRDQGARGDGGGGGGAVAAWARTLEAAACRARALVGACRWAEALRALDAADPWLGAELRAACLVELRRSSQLFALAHALVDAYPHSWTAWFAVGCYYYLIGKSEFARRYLSKAKSLAPGAGCVWLAYGHSFAADSEHDQAMAAYFKASQLLPGCHLPPLYVGVECSLLHNVSMCERFLTRAALLHNDHEAASDFQSESCLSTGGGGGGAFTGWGRVVAAAGEPYVAPADPEAWPADYEPQLHPRWAATLDGLGHACRRLGRVREALRWHERALALRPARARSLAAQALCLALLGREPRAAAALHAALAREPDEPVAGALLDAILDRLDAALTEEEIPQFPFPAIQVGAPTSPGAAPAPGPPAPGTPRDPCDLTTTSDMSMSFD